MSRGSSGLAREIGARSRRHPRTWTLAHDVRDIVGPGERNGAEIA